MISNDVVTTKLTTIDRLVKKQWINSEKTVKKHVNIQEYIKNYKNEW